MHYVIAAKALRKVFISIKGIYYQVEVRGQTVTWLVNHQRGFKVGNLISCYFCFILLIELILQPTAHIII